MDFQFGIIQCILVFLLFGHIYLEQEELSSSVKGYDTSLIRIKAAEKCRIFRSFRRRSDLGINSFGVKHYFSEPMVRLSSVFMLIYPSNCIDSAKFPISSVVAAHLNSLIKFGHLYQNKLNNLSYSLIVGKFRNNTSGYIPIFSVVFKALGGIYLSNPRHDKRIANFGLNNYRKKNTCRGFLDVNPGRKGGLKGGRSCLDGIQGFIGGCKILGYCGLSVYNNCNKFTEYKGHNFCEFHVNAYRFNENLNENESVSDCVRNLQCTKPLTLNEKLEIIYRNKCGSDLMADSAKYLRNFSIIAHIDHGKSSVSDCLLKLTGTIQPIAKAQYLDTLEVERLRGITVKAQTCTMVHMHDGKPYILNLIDTPGHADFSFEVERSLAASDGCVLLVDACRGLQAQSLKHLRTAQKAGKKIIAAINKVDLVTCKSHANQIRASVSKASGVPFSEIHGISAKTGEGIQDLLLKIIKDLPPPSVQIGKNGEAKALVFEEGQIKTGETLKAMESKKMLHIREVGVLCPEMTKLPSLKAGQVGYVVSNVREFSEIRLGDTLFGIKAKGSIFPAFKPPNRLVYAGLYPEDPSEYERFSVALSRLKLTDYSLEISPANSNALGPGFRCGFLGSLHMEVVVQRLKSEHGISALLTLPSVEYRVTTRDNKTIFVENTRQMPLKVKRIEEPVAEATVVCSVEYIPVADRLLKERRGQLIEQQIIDGSTTMSKNDEKHPVNDQNYRSQEHSIKGDSTQLTMDTSVYLRYVLPLSEAIKDLHSALLSATSGNATLDVCPSGFQESSIECVGILLNGKEVDPLCFLAHESTAKEQGMELAQRLQQELPAQLFEIRIQCIVGKRKVGTFTIRPRRKDVTAKCYGGDNTRKMKLLQKQKEGKRKLRMIGAVCVPSEAFANILKTHTG